MRVLFINTTCGVGSHGRICGELAEEYEKQGHECVIAYGRECSKRYAKYGHQIGNKFNVYVNILNTRLLDNHGLSSKLSTKTFLKWANDYNPDLLWLHNIHGYYINYELLFAWIKTRPNMTVKWTLHDCWAFTGHCGFFTMAGCEKWKKECSDCPLKTDYPSSLFIDNSKNNYLRKKKAFTKVNNLTLITPSKWLADLVKMSFLKEYTVEVRYNSIDPSIFKQTASDLRTAYNIENKIIILGVANVWHKRKGLDDFITLAKMLNDDYRVVLVGFSQKQIDRFEKYTSGIHRVTSTHGNIFRAEGDIRPSRVAVNAIKRTENGVVIDPDVYVLYNEITNGKTKNSSGTEIILISRTNSTLELAGLYSTADFYINPTHEDNYPTTNLEAQACGTYVITYNVGGCIETIK